ncbi:MAG: hypothetical protein CVV64_02665 [Candidatus Wallbacteria bacterium HGW-Wallbacteria-1]|jgi:adenylate cyclase|uniref:Adenylate cyclase n=1 Tax=Candidatus Wallbacteria bacterium HGW-Wallbacteria-1 TaxID=2013854 RepID=A0A2N1PTD1_9BACT|nr:MAG: hypothetical protein CVV64_02665 [Candidatus Wallbacteria bacterium HGW-Wallbacteria-1]
MHILLLSQPALYGLAGALVVALVLFTVIIMKNMKKNAKRNLTASADPQSTTARIDNIESPSRAVAVASSPAASSVGNSTARISSAPLEISADPDARSISVRFTTNSPERKTLYTVKKKRVTIGRVKDNDFVVSEPNISGHHAVLVLEDEGTYRLEDKGSTNGTTVNGVKITSQQLKSGDVVKFGPLEFCFLSEQESADAAMQEAGKLISKIQEQAPSQLSSNLQQLKSDYELLHDAITESKNLNRTTLIDKLSSFSTRIAVITNDYNKVERTQEMINTLFETSQVISSILDMEKLLNTLMDLVINVMKAERGFIMLKDEDSGTMVPRIARKMEQQIMGEGKEMLSRSIAEKALKEKKPILTTDAQEDPRFMSGQSVIAFNIRSVMVVPLTTKDDVIGVIYIDNREKAGAFTDSDLNFLTMFAAQAAVAIENAQLYASVENRINELSTIAEIIRAINSTLDLDKVLNLILDMTMDLIGVEKGSIVLLDEKRQKYFVRALKGDFKELYLGAKVSLGNSIAGKVASNGRSVMINKIDPNASNPGGLQKYTSLLAVALKIKDKVIGVLNLTDKKDGGKFSNNDLSLVESLAYQAAQACENARLYENVKDEERMRTNLTRFLSPDIVNQIIQTGDGELSLGGEKKTVTMLFTDLRNFTNTCEKMEPGLLVTTLNEYFSEMTEVIFEYGGTLDKFMGDAIMVLFGAPFGHPDDALRAVCTGWTMLEKLKLLHEKWQMEGKPQFEMGIGIHTGDVIAGNVGSVKRMEYTVIGRNVNRASRLESSNKEMGTSFLISKDTLEKVRDLVEVREAGAPHMKGIEVPEVVYEVTGLKPGAREKALESLKNPN